MITYSKSTFGFHILFAFTGTAWPFGLLPGFSATAISLALSYWEAADDEIRERSDFISHPYAFQLFAYLLGFVIVFRTQLAYQRYWEAVGSLQAMAAKWLDGVLMAIVFDAGGTNEHPLLWGVGDRESRSAFSNNGHLGGPTHAEFYSDVVHLCSLLHALALQHLRADDNMDNLESAYSEVPTRKPSSEAISVTSDRSKSPNATLSVPKGFGLPSFREPAVRDTIAKQKLPVLGGISDAERSCLEFDITGQPMHTEARVAMVESWLMRRCLARQKFEQGHSAVTSPPILSRIYQVISDGTLWFGAAKKIAETPFPFPYRNILSIFLWMFTLMAPILINGIIFSTPLRACLTFSAVFAYHALNSIGDNLEDPYLPYDPNELPLPAMQHSVNMRLYSFGIVPPRSNGMKGASSGPSRFESNPRVHTPSKFQEREISSPRIGSPQSKGPAAAALLAEGAAVAQASEG
eukprot:CAMPEP_0178430950 /NCGR_PEP_ID=MMETSP0689_2-20121128/31585_1 /TAXON_ID=160604 /ORGANISM="Amphidinium massartii, Strain CS-259" /LENGTH=463 /DNA_ID=CAMNT_0020052825 /DNA_START=61 /DNA_END=1449 /DNA_ORIENTATION=+